MAWAERTLTKAEPALTERVKAHQDKQREAERREQKRQAKQDKGYSL